VRGLFSRCGAFARRAALTGAAAVLAGGTAAGAATALYVDGACAVAGDGRSLAPCAASPGGAGPFARISAGVAALGPGGTLFIRGRHDGFDGVYRGEYLGIWGDHHLDCRTSRCTIRGWADERPVISGFKTYDDWRPVAPGSPVWFRDMERHDECQGMGLSGGRAARRTPDADWDPQVIVQDRGGTRMPLQYDDRVGDARLAGERLREDGTWWHDLAGHRSYVNPYGDGDPNRDPRTVLLVPQEQALVVIDASGACGPGSSAVSHNVLFQQLVLEGPRSKFVEVNGGVGEPATDIRFEGITTRFTGGKYAVHVHRVRRFAIDGWSSEWIGRGVSWPDHGHAFRTFGLDHATLAGITCRHLGTDNKGKRPFLDPPWGNARTSWWWGGTCVQVKQSNDVTVRDLVAEDLSLVGVALDVSRRTVVENFDIRRAAAGIGMHEFTPMPEVGCDERNEAHFCHNYDDVIRNGTIHASGIDGAGAIVVERNQRDAHKKLQPGQYTARIYNVAISYPGAAALQVHDLDAVSLWNVSVYGDMATLFPGRPVRPAKGVVLLGDVQRFESRNNVFARLGDAALDVAPAALAGGAAPAFDHDLFELGGGAVARWKGATYATLGGPHGFREAGQEPAGREGRARFRATPGSLARPPDLHLGAGSEAAGMGTALAARFDADADGKPRRRWDAGAYVADGAAPAAAKRTGLE
jgi:hypothetical protein